MIKITIIDFTQYQAPNVYVEQIASSLVGVVGIAPSVVAIVGPSVGYKTITEAYVLNGTSLITLNQLGANPQSIVVANQTGTTYQASDFQTTTLVGTTQYLNQVQIQRTPTSNIPTASVVYITYQYTDQNYFTPQSYSSYTDVVNSYGAPLSANNIINSPLTLAAQMAFINGAATVVIVPTTDTGGTATRSGLSNAYLQLGALTNVDIIVPLPVGIVGQSGGPGDTINVGLDLEQFCVSQATQGNYIVGLLGYDAANSIAPDQIAQAIQGLRVQEHWPNQLSFYNGANNQTFTVSGYYLAAAWAGVAASLNRQVPLTKKHVSGFSGLPNSVFTTMTIPYKNQLAQAGVAVTEQISGGGLQMRHGVTTNTSSVMTRELSLVRAGDAMIELIQNTLDASGLIGSAFGPNTLGIVKAQITGALEALVNQDVIVGYTNLGVQQTSGNPVVVLVQFQYQPAYPLNYILVQFSVNTDTGTISPVTAPNPTGSSSAPTP